MNEQFNKNAKVEKLTKKVGRGVRLIVKGPYLFFSKFPSWCRSTVFLKLFERGTTNDDRRYNVFL